MQTKPPVVVISAEKADRYYTHNVVATMNLKRKLDELMPGKVAQGRGRYNEAEEAVFVIVLNGGTSSSLWRDLVKIAREFEQDTMLYIGANREALLYHVDDNVSPKWAHLGRLVEITYDEAVAAPAWTLIGDKYYTAKAI